MLCGFYYFKFVKVCFVAPNVVYLGDCSIWAQEECVFWCWIKLSIDFSYIQLIDDTDGFKCIYQFFCLLGLSISNREVLQFLAIWVDLYLFLSSFISFCFTYFDALFDSHTLAFAISSWRIYPFVIM